MYRITHQNRAQKFVVKINNYVQEAEMRNLIISASKLFCFVAVTITIYKFTLKVFMYVTASLVGEHLSINLDLALN